jgi:hypothetical protein
MKSTVGKEEVVKVRVVLTGHLLSVGGRPAQPVAVFAQCNDEGPCLGAEKIVIPLDSESEARLLGAMLYQDFTITVEQADEGVLGPGASKE